MKYGEEVVRHVLVIRHRALLRVYFIQVQPQFLRVFLFVLFRDLLKFFLSQGGIFTFVNDLFVVDFDVDHLHDNGQPSDKYIFAAFIPDAFPVLQDIQNGHKLVNKSAVMQNVDACPESHIVGQDFVLFLFFTV